MLKDRLDDVDHAIVPEEYEILDTESLASRLGFKRDTIQVYLNSKSFHRIRRLATGPLWYGGSVRRRELRNRLKHGKPQP